MATTGSADPTSPFCLPDCVECDGDTCLRCAKKAALYQGACVRDCGFAPGLAKVTLADGSHECQQGSVLTQYGAPTSGSVLQGFDLRSLTGTTLEACAVACLGEGHFCLSYEFNADLGSCNLNSQAAAADRPLTAQAGWAYYARQTFDDGAFLQDGAFIEFGFSSLLQNIDDVSISFLTPKPDAMLWRQGQTGASATEDFMGVHLANGRAVVAVDLGDGPFELSVAPVEGRLDDNAFHTVRVLRNGRFLAISVDGEVPVQARYPGSSSTLEVSSPIYVGNYSPELGVHDSGLASGQYIPPLLGCVRDLLQSNKEISLFMDATTSSNAFPCPL